MAHFTEEKKFIGEDFHKKQNKVFGGDFHYNAIIKDANKIANVAYERVHENSSFDDVRRGSGKVFVKWLFSEEKGTEENLLSGGFELMHDSRLEPSAAIGYHKHHETEEIYYLLEGQLRMTIVTVEGKEIEFVMNPGDAHAVRVGEAHFGCAGTEGARFIAVAFRPAKGSL